MSLSPTIESLIQSLRCLPGVGPKSAQRMTFHLLQHDRLGAKKLIQAMQQALDKVGYCQRCRMLCETDICEYCEHPRRDDTLLCIVASPADVMAIESSQQYRGRYFVLMGHLSPLDQIGPQEIGMDLLEQRLKLGGIQEIILATHPTVEGEATAHYIGSMAKLYQVKTTRIAHGVPMGGDLEYVDAGTLAMALRGRNAYE